MAIGILYSFGVGSPFSEAPPVVLVPSDNPSFEIAGTGRGQAEDWSIIITVNGSPVNLGDPDDPGRIVAEFTGDEAYESFEQDFPNFLFEYTQPFDFGGEVQGALFDDPEVNQLERFEVNWVFNLNPETSTTYGFKFSFDDLVGLSRAMDIGVASEVNAESFAQGWLNQSPINVTPTTVTPTANPDEFLFEFTEAVVQDEFNSGILNLTGQTTPSNNGPYLITASISATELVAIRDPKGAPAFTPDASGTATISHKRLLQEYDAHIRGEAAGSFEIVTGVNDTISYLVETQYNDEDELGIRIILPAGTYDSVADLMGLTVQYADDLNTFFYAFGDRTFNLGDLNPAAGEYDQKVDFIIEQDSSGSDILVIKINEDSLLTNHSTVRMAAFTDLAHEDIGFPIVSQLERSTRHEALVTTDHVKPTTWRDNFGNNENPSDDLAGGEQDPAVFDSFSTTAEDFSSSAGLTFPGDGYLVVPPPSP